MQVTKFQLTPSIESDDFDPKFMVRDVIRIEFPMTNGEISDKYLAMINKITNSCYSIKIKYLKPIDNKCRYTIIKGVSKYVPPLNKSDKIEINVLEHALKEISNADLTISGSHLIFHVISHIPLNQEVDVGDVFYINLENQYSSDKRYYVRSKSIKTNSKHIPFDSNIFLGSIDIGGVITGEFVVSFTDQNNSRRAYHFTRLQPNVVEIITLNYVCSPEFILKELNLTEILDAMNKDKKK